MRARHAAAAALLAAVVLSGCGGGGDGGGSAASTNGDGSTGTPVQVDAKDFSLTLLTTSFSPGEHIFEMTNDGRASHAIDIQGPGVENAESDIVGPGGTASVTVTLQQGDYTMFCPVGNHRALGMETSFTVG